MQSYVQKGYGKPIWTVHFAAELAWYLRGHHGPEKLYDRPAKVARYVRFVDETPALWRYLNEDIERNSKSRKGPKPSAERLFKAAVCAFVGRKLIHPNGGNHTVVPSAKDLSQVWFVLFGELERHDSLKKLLERLPVYLKDFQRFASVKFTLELSHYRTLIKPLELHYPARRT